MRTTTHSKQVRAYGERPARVQKEREQRLEVSRREEAIELAKRDLGWRVYATNQVLMSLATTAGVYARQIRVWDVATGQLQIDTRPAAGYPAVVRFLPGGKTALVVVHGSPRGHLVYRWNVAPAPPDEVITQHTDEIWRLVLAPDGRKFVFGSHGYRDAPWGNQARLWSLQPDKPIGAPLQHAGRVFALAFSPDGRKVLTGSHDRTTRFWDAATGRPLGPPRQHPGQIHAVAFSPDGRYYVTAGSDRTARRWEVSTHRPIDPCVQHKDTIESVLYTPNGQLLVTASTDRTARFRDAESGLPVGPAMRHLQAIAPLAISPDGRWVATGGGDGFATIWRVPALNLRAGGDFVQAMERQTGLTLEGSSVVRLLSAEEWLQR